MEEHGGANTSLGAARVVASPDEGERGRGASEGGCKGADKRKVKLEWWGRK